MAVQTVDYYDDDVVFEHGPFVVCRVTGMDHCRIEVAASNSKCPVFLNASVYKMLRAKTECPEGCTHYDKIAPWVEWLNNRVRDGEIVLAGNTWVAPRYLGTDGT